MLLDRGIHLHWAGSLVFIGTGVLFGLTALAFGPVGALAAIGIIAGVFVAIIMVIQELETWLESFDDPEENKKSLTETFTAWKNSLTWRKALGMLISMGNVVALSLLFTMGLASFFMGIGVPAFTAVIAGFAVAFTGGAFTEFYFYNRFLSNFCDKFAEKWDALWKTNYPLIGIGCAAANAIVNAALSYAAIIMITSLLAAASIAAPPLGVVIAVAAISAFFAGTASFILGMDFWIGNSAKFISYFSGEEEVVAESQNDTKAIVEKLELSNDSVAAVDEVATVQDQATSFSSSNRTTADLYLLPPPRSMVDVQDMVGSYDFATVMPAKAGIQ